MMSYLKRYTVTVVLVVLGAVTFSLSNCYAQQNNTERQKETLFKFKTPGQYADQIEQLFAQHRWNRGKEVLDDALEKWPHDPNLHYLAGIFWWNAKNPDKARFHLVKCVSINYNHVDAKQMLVNVEEATGNYSSAICYINELLEVNPYWKGLWVRKIDLYKKLGNYEEANILLKRLREIYPNDAQLVAGHYELLESAYIQAKNNNDYDEEESALKDMVKINPRETDYQLAYANILIERGQFVEAVDALFGAINYNPGNVDLNKKLTDLLMVIGNNMGAISFLADQLRINPSPELQALYDRIVEASAYIRKDADSYNLYTRAYNRSHNSEALDYLLSESFRRNYYDDCIHYISEARKRRKDAPNLWLMEYEVYLRSNHPDMAAKTLEMAEAKYPKEYDINIAANRARMREAADYMNEEAWGKAIPILEKIHSYCVDDEMMANTVRRLATCYINKNEFEKAREILKEKLRYEPEWVVTSDYANLLAKEGRLDESLDLIYREFLKTKDTTARKALTAAYEERAIPYIKSLMQEGSSPKALRVCDNLLSLDPDNYWALRYAIQASPTPELYMAKAYSVYPNDVYFQQKEATRLSLAGEDNAALSILRPLLKDHPGDTLLKGAYADVSERLAFKLMKQRDYERAAIVLDSALRQNPTNASLRYDRGIIYEKQKIWDSAFVFQSAYRPALLEEKEYLARMNTLLNKRYKNTIEVGYDWLRFSDSDVKNGIAEAGYSRSWKQNTLGVKVYYTGRAGFEASEDNKPESGGRGYRFDVDYTRELGSRWTGNAILSYGTKYFPKFAANVDLTYHATDNWDFGGGALFRSMADTSQMYGVNLAATWQSGHFMAGTKLTGGSFHSKLFGSGLLRGRYYIYEDGKTFIEAQCGAGSAPELTFSDLYYAPGIYNHLNSFVSLGANWLIVPGLSVNVSASWNTLYYNKEDVYYKNLLMCHVQFVIYF